MRRTWSFVFFGALPKMASARLRSRLTRPPSTATLLASLALFVSLSGVAYAAATIGSPEVIDNSLQSVDLRDGAAVSGADVVNESLQGVDIQEATLKGVSRKVLLTATAGDPPTARSIGPIGGYTVTLNCEHHDSLPPAWYVFARLVVRGPGGDFQSAYTSTTNDGSAQTVTARGTLPAGVNTTLAQSDAYNGYFARKAGTVFVRSGASLLQIDFQLFRFLDAATSKVWSNSRTRLEYRASQNTGFSNCFG